MAAAATALFDVVFFSFYIHFLLAYLRSIFTSLKKDAMAEKRRDAEQTVGGWVRDWH